MELDHKSVKAIADNFARRVSGQLRQMVRRMLNLTRLCVSLVLVAAAAACEDLGPNISGVPAYNISSVKISPALDTIFITDTIRVTDRAFFTAQAIGKSLVPLSITEFVWASSNPNVATIDEDGVVTPVNIGTTEISASAGKVGRATLVVAAATAVVDLSPAVDTIEVGTLIEAASDTVRLVATARTPAGVPLSGVAFTWESLSNGVATVDATGLVHAVSLGTATIRVRASGSQATAIVVVTP